MKPTVERLCEEFKQLIGPEALAKAEAAIAAAKVAAEAAAKAAAEKAAAAKAAALAAKPAAPVAPANVGGVTSPRISEPNPRGEGTPPTAAGAATPRPAPPATASVNPPVAPADIGGVPPPRIAPSPTVGGVPPPRNSEPSPRSGVTPPTTAPRSAAPAAPRPAPAVPAVSPLPTLPVQAVKHAEKGCDFEATVAPNQVVPAAQILDRQGFALDAVTGVDWIAQNEMEVVYDFFHPVESVRVVVRTRIPRPTPELPTISTVFPGANWHEREAHDFFGILFTGHPNLKPFLLPEDADFHPLRKDYQP